MILNYFLEINRFYMQYNRTLYKKISRLYKALTEVT